MLGTSMKNEVDLGAWLRSIGAPGAIRGRQVQVGIGLGRGLLVGVVVGVVVMVGVGRGRRMRTGSENRLDRMKGL